jgi:hypothetical protein
MADCARRALRVADDHRSGSRRQEGDACESRTAADAGLHDRRTAGMRRHGGGRAKVCLPGCQSSNSCKHGRRCLRSGRRCQHLPGHSGQCDIVETEPAPLRGALSDLTARGMSCIRACGCAGLGCRGRGGGLPALKRIRGGAGRGTRRKLVSPAQIAIAGTGFLIGVLVVGAVLWVAAYWHRPSATKTAEVLGRRRRGRRARSRRGCQAQVGPTQIQSTCRKLLQAPQDIELMALASRVQIIHAARSTFFL